MRCKTNEVFEVSNVCSCEATQSSSGSFCALNIPLLPKRVRKRVGRSLRWLLLINEVGIARLLSLVAAWLPSFVCVHCLHSDPRTPTAHAFFIRSHCSRCRNIDQWYFPRHCSVDTIKATNATSKGWFFSDKYYIWIVRAENKEHTILTTTLLYKIPMYT